MIARFLKENTYAAWALMLLRVYIGWQWMTAGWGKVTGGFDASGYLNGAIAKAGGESPIVQGWWGSFLESFALPNVELFNVLVAWGELLVGIGLIVGCLTAFSALMGVIMNVAFLLSGTISTNPEMLVMGIIVLAAGANAGKIGLDYYVIPFIRNLFKHRSEKPKPPTDTDTDRESSAEKREALAG